MRRATLTAAALLALAACQERGAGTAATQDAGAGSAAASATAERSSVSDAAVVSPEPSSPPGELPKAMELYRAADEAFQQGDFAAALKQAQAAAAADPSLPLTWNLVGRAAARRFEATRDAKLATTALEAYGRAVKLDPNFLPAWQNLGELGEKLGRTRDAAEAYARVLALSPDHPDRERLQAYVEQAR